MGIGQDILKFLFISAVLLTCISWVLFRLSGAAPWSRHADAEFNQRLHRAAADFNPLDLASIKNIPQELQLEILLAIQKKLHQGSSNQAGKPIVPWTPNDLPPLAKLPKSAQEEILNDIRERMEQMTGEPRTVEESPPKVR